MLTLLVLLVHHLLAGVDHQLGLRVVVVVALGVTAPELLLLLGVHQWRCHLSGLGFVAGVVNGTSRGRLVNRVGLAEAVVLNRGPNQYKILILATKSDY